MKRKAAAFFLAIQAATIVLLIASVVVHWLAAGTLPVSWSFFFVFGFDETTEKYGVQGELVRLWLCSLPTSAI